MFAIRIHGDQYLTILKKNINQFRFLVSEWSRHTDSVVLLSFGHQILRSILNLINQYFCLSADPSQCKPISLYIISCLNPFSSFLSFPFCRSYSSIALLLRNLIIVPYPSFTLSVKK